MMSQLHPARRSRRARGVPAVLVIAMLVAHGARAQSTGGNGTAGEGRAGQGTAGQGTAGQGTAGQGTAGQGTAGQGTAAMRVGARADTGRFESEIRAYEERDRQAPPTPGGVLFVGSSTIRLWCTLDRDFPELRVLNRGFGGSTMREVLDNAERIVLPARPRTIVVYAGDNDLADGATPAQVHASYAQFATLIHARLPEARLVYLAVKPSPSRVRLLPAVRMLNTMLQADAGRDGQIRFVDVYTPMLAADGAPRAELFGGDGLHMNSSGYALWHGVLAPVLDAAR